MDLSPDLAVGLTSIGAAVGGVAVVAVRTAIARWAAPAGGDRESHLPPQPRAARLDAASVHARCTAANTAGPSACVALVSELGAEAAREECASCTGLRRELRDLRTEATGERNDRIAELRSVLPSLERAVTAQNAATDASREGTAALGELTEAVRALLARGVP